MINPPRGESQCGQNVRFLEVRQFRQHLLAVQSLGQQVQYVADPDAHAPDAGRTPALPRVHGDSFCQCSMGDTSLCDGFILRSRRL